MIDDIWQDFLSAGSAATSGFFTVMVTYGAAFLLVALVIGVVLFFTHASERGGKTLMINAAVGLVIVCSAYMIAFSTGTLPDLSGIFVLPATGP